MIRPATSVDAAAIATIERQLFDDPWDEGALTDALAPAGRRAWAHLDDTGELRGYALTGLSGDFAEVLRIGVHPDHQRRGLARALLETTLAAARKDGADRMLLEVSAANRPAIGFYVAEGFTQIDVRPRYYRDGSDALVLRRALVGGCGGSGRMGA